MLEGRHRLADELVKAANRLFRGGLQTSDGGNLSSRLPDRSTMLIKASGSSFGDLVPEDLCVCDLDGALLAGTAKPSRESLLHGELYKRFPEIGAVVHCHSPWATAWAGAKGDLPASTHHADLKLGPTIKAVDTGGYAVEPESFPKIFDIALSHPKRTAFLLVRHGQVAMGADLREAVSRAELVEETARIAFLAATLGALPV